jgi:DNA-directed RNA polymerase omega subunit
MSKPIGLSRGPAIDTNQCVDMAGGNRFNLVLIAAARAREIRRQHRESETREHIYPNITALLEIQNGKVGAEYLKRVR